MESFQNYIATNEEAKNLEFYYTLREKCYNLKTKGVINDLLCHQIEADNEDIFSCQVYKCKTRGYDPYFN